MNEKMKKYTTRNKKNMNEKTKKVKKKERIHSIISLFCFVFIKTKKSPHKSNLK